MGRLSTSSLVVLIWASAALATPCESNPPAVVNETTMVATNHARTVIAEPLSSRDLEVRQGNAKCPTSYSSRNGMNFTTYCEQNNPFNDALAPFETNSMQECMEKCSRYWGNGEGCFGVVWREDKQCWLRNSTTSTKGLTPLAGNHAALVEASDVTALDTKCPETDLSTHDLGNGIGYTVHCGKVIGGFDACFQGYPTCEQSPFIGYYHATSLQNCLEICVKEHPLCRAVSYNPGLEIGFANCWPKTGFTANLDTPPAKQGIIHTATITSLDRIDTSCPKSSSYTASGNKPFEVHCGKLNVGTNITSIHMQNITSCMDACAASDKGCIGVLFDSSMQGGYSNCYLQNTTSVISDQAQATYAVLSNTPLPSSSGTAGSGSNSGSSSKAWIAGPVIGGLAALALIGFALFWWRRRKSNGAGNAQLPEKDTTGSAPAYTPYTGDAANGYYANGAPPNQSELGGDHLTELAADEHPSATKYAQAEAKHTHQTHEMP